MPTDPPPKKGSLYSSKYGKKYCKKEIALDFPPGYRNGDLIIFPTDVCYPTQISKRLV